MAPQHWHCPHPDGTPPRSWDPHPELRMGSCGIPVPHLPEQLLKTQAGGVSEG